MGGFKGLKSENWDRIKGLTLTEKYLRQNRMFADSIDKALKLIHAMLDEFVFVTTFKTKGALLTHATWKCEFQTILSLLNFSIGKITTDVYVRTSQHRFILKY